VKIWQAASFDSRSLKRKVQVRARREEDTTLGTSAPLSVEGCESSTKEAIEIILALTSAKERSRVLVSGSGSAVI
jgi:predicted transposase YdaD